MVGPVDVRMDLDDPVNCGALEAGPQVRKKGHTMNLVLLGAPGAGKGTMAELLVQDYGYAHISTGDILRAAVKKGTELGLEAKKYMDAGELVPDSVVIGLVSDRLTEPDTQDGFILDGFPRTIPQAEALTDELAKLDRPIDAAIAINVSKEVIVKRLTSRRCCRQCGKIGSVADEVCPDCGGEMYQRDDDKEEVILNRLEVYHENTAPLIDYYRDQGLLVEIDADDGILAVYDSMKRAINL